MTMKMSITIQKILDHAWLMVCCIPFTTIIAELNGGSTSAVSGDKQASMANVIPNHSPAKIQ